MITNKSLAMKTKIKKTSELFILCLFLSVAIPCFADSQPFPAITSPPTASSILPNPLHTYYCSPTGNNTSGDGSINNPWTDLRGAQGTVGAGDLVYFRGGAYPSYPRTNHSYSQNRLVTNGTATQPIVFTNYPGEIATWNSTNKIWSVTLQADHQKLIGTKVGGSFGIKITGGASTNGDYSQFSGIEFVNGTAQGNVNAADNPAMLSVPLNDGVLDLVISHNIFRDSRFATTPERMTAIKLFQTTNLKVEYNIFKDNIDLYDGAISFKGDTINARIKYNRFHNCNAAIQYVAQTDDGVIDGIEISNNLFHSMIESTIYFTNEVGRNIRIFNNVSLSTAPFFYYLNADPVAFDSDHGEYYDNIIDSTAFIKGWHDNSNNSNNLPSYFNFNLWRNISDHNTLSSWGSQGWYSNAVVSPDLGLSYDANIISVVATNNYPGLSAGRYGGNIGGFIFNDSGTITIRADVDQQNGITTTDALLTLRNSLGLNMSGTGWHASSTTGDVNCDGNTNAADALLLLRQSLGLGMTGTGWCLQ